MNPRRAPAQRSKQTPFTRGRVYKTSSALTHARFENKQAKKCFSTEKTNFKQGETSTKQIRGVRLFLAATIRWHNGIIVERSRQPAPAARSKRPGSI